MALASNILREEPAAYICEMMRETRRHLYQNPEMYYCNTSGCGPPVLYRLHSCSLHATVDCWQSRLDRNPQDISKWRDCRHFRLFPWLAKKMVAPPHNDFVRCSCATWRRKECKTQRAPSSSLAMFVRKKTKELSSSLSLSIPVVRSPERGLGQTPVKKQR